jgi:membrane-bound metal-dependent hydrolase YbcI (DUF457 family)
MPEPLLHFSIVFTLTASKLGVKKALALSLLAVFPDFDVLFHVHRSMSHSILIPLAIGLPVLLMLTKATPQYTRFGVFGLAAIISHSLLDCFQGYTPIVYPVVSNALWIDISGRLLITSTNVTPHLSTQLNSTPNSFEPFETMDTALFTSEGLFIAIILVAPTIILAVKPWLGMFAQTSFRRLHRVLPWYSRKDLDAFKQ